MDAQTINDATKHAFLTDPILSVVGGGLAAAIVTAIFNVFWDVRKQKSAEEWEFRRYQANLIHFGIVGLTDSFFSAKSELLYLTSTLQVLWDTLAHLANQADQIVRQQGGPHLTVAELEQRKQQLLQPFQNFNNQQVQLRWSQYEQKAKENHAKAEVHLTALKPLIANDLYNDLLAMFQHLSAPFVWDLPNARQKLATLEAAMPEILGLRERLSQELEKKLGRKV